MIVIDTFKFMKLLEIQKCELTEWQKNAIHNAFSLAKVDDTLVKGKFFVTHISVIGERTNISNEKITIEMEPSEPQNFIKALMEKIKVNNNIELYIK